MIDKIIDRSEICQEVLELVATDPKINPAASLTNSFGLSICRACPIHFHVPELDIGHNFLTIVFC